MCGIFAAVLVFTYRFIRVVDASSAGELPRDAGISWRHKKGGVVGRGHPEWWSPAIWILMKRDSEDCEAKGRGLNTKRYQAQWNPEPPAAIKSMSCCTRNSTVFL